jgi:quercetin dioxygenase-like cupin family protein
MRAYLKAAVIVPLVASALIAQTPVPVEQEPHHHVVWKNDSVEVIRVVVPAGESTLFHTHSRDRVAVDLTSTMLSFQKLNETEGQPEPSIPGDISSHADFDAPYTHRVHNVGEKTYEVLDVEFFERPEHPSEIAAATVAAENPSARVYKWNLAPGGATTVHVHEHPYILVAVTSSRLKTTAPDGTSAIEVVKAGDYRWVTAKGPHTLANAGSADGQIVEIELK